MEYDAIVVGARCAGATLAIYLARAGLNVLLLDSAKMPRDMTLSTHFIQGAGMKVLDELGVGDELRRIAPPTKYLHSYLNDVHVKSEFNDNCLPYCIRRIHVDSVLQAEAQRSGALLMTETTVINVIWESGRVAGVISKKNNEITSYRSRLIIGADGPNSIIARLTNSNTYLTDTLKTPAFWTYIQTPEVWNSNKYENTDMIVEWSDSGYRSVFQTDGNALLISASSEEIHNASWNMDDQESFLSYLSRSARVGPLIKNAIQIGKARCIKNADFYLRKPIGPGYLLLGDAGCRKHFVSGQGMTEAFIEARNISKAILIDTEAGYRQYWRERDSRVVPLYLDAKFQSSTEKINTYFIRKLFSELARKTEYANRLTMSCNRDIKPKAIFTIPMLLKPLIRSLYTCDVRFLRDLMIYLSGTLTSDLRDELLIKWLHAVRWRS